MPTLDQAIASIAAQSPHWAGVVELAAAGNRGAVLELAGKVRKVKTAKGAEYYGLPIGSPIVKKGGKPKDHDGPGSSSSGGGSSTTGPSSSTTASSSSSSSNKASTAATSPSSSAGPATPAELMAAVKAAPKTSGTTFSPDQRGEATLKALQLAATTKHPHKIYIDQASGQIKVTKQKNLPPEGTPYALVRYTGKATNVDAQGNTKAVPHERVAALVAPHLDGGQPSDAPGEPDTPAAPAKPAAKSADGPAKPAQKPQDAPGDAPAPDPAPKPDKADEAADAPGDTSTPAGLMAAAKATPKVPGLVFPSDQIGLAGLKALQLAGSTKHPHKLYYDDAGQIRITKQKNVPPPGTPHSLVRYTGKAWEVDGDGKQTPLAHSDLVAMVGPHLAAPDKKPDAPAGPLSAPQGDLNAPGQVQAPAPTPEPAAATPSPATPSPAAPAAPAEAAPKDDFDAVVAKAELHSSVLVALQSAQPNPELADALEGADDLLNEADDLPHQLGWALVNAKSSGQALYVAPVDPAATGWEVDHQQSATPTVGQDLIAVSPDGALVMVSGSDGKTWPLGPAMAVGMLDGLDKKATAAKAQAAEPDEPNGSDAPAGAPGGDPWDADVDGDQGAPGASLAVQAALVNPVPTDATDLASLVVAAAQTDGFGQGLPIGIEPDGPGTGTWKASFLAGAGGYELQPDGTLDQVGVGPVSQDLVDSLVAAAAAKHGYVDTSDPTPEQIAAATPATPAPSPTSAEGLAANAKTAKPIKTSSKSTPKTAQMAALQSAIVTGAPHYVGNSGGQPLTSPPASGAYIVFSPDGSAQSVKGTGEPGKSYSAQALASSWGPVFEQKAKTAAAASEKPTVTPAKGMGPTVKLALAEPDLTVSPAGQKASTLGMAVAFQQAVKTGKPHYWQAVPTGAGAGGWAVTTTPPAGVHRVFYPDGTAATSYGPGTTSYPLAPSSVKKTWVNGAKYSTATPAGQGKPYVPGPAPDSPATPTPTPGPSSASPSTSASSGPGFGKASGSKGPSATPQPHPETPADLVKYGKTKNGKHVKVSHAEAPAEPFQSTAERLAAKKAASSSADALADTPVDDTPTPPAAHEPAAQKLVDSAFHAVGLPVIGTNPSTGSPYVSEMAAYALVMAVKQGTPHYVPLKPGGNLVPSSATPTATVPDGDYLELHPDGREYMGKADGSTQLVPTVVVNKSVQPQLQKLAPAGNGAQGGDEFDKYAYGTSDPGPEFFRQHIEYIDLEGGEGRETLADSKVNIKSHPKATAAEHAAMEWYTGPGSSPINAYLRGHTSGSPAITNAVAQLDTLAQKYVTSGWTYLRRGLTSDADFPLEQLQPGDRFSEVAFASSSYGSGFGGPVRLNIALPPGSRGIPTNARGTESHPGELEFILPRSTRYVVDSDTIVGGQRFINVTALPPARDAPAPGQQGTIVWKGQQP